MHPSLLLLPFLACSLLPSQAEIEYNLFNNLTAGASSRDYTFSPIDDHYIPTDQSTAPSFDSTAHRPHYTYQAPKETALKKPKARFLNLFPNGGVVFNTMKLSVPVPICKYTQPDGLVLPCTTFDVSIPFSYNLPKSQTNLFYSGRKMEEDHAAVFQMGEELLTKFGLNGKACILRLICELAESNGLHHNGLLGKAFETIFLIDYGMSTTERLYEYISARTYGEHEGNCNAAYPQCPFSAFNVMENADLEKIADTLGGLANEL